MKAELHKQIENTDIIQRKLPEPSELSNKKKPFTQWRGICICLQQSLSLFWPWLAKQKKIIKKKGV